MSGLDHLHASCRSLLTKSAVACAVMFPMAACTGQSIESDDMSTTADVTTDAAHQAAPMRTLNTAPRRSYQVNMLIENAPGPFAVVEGVAQYDVVNEDECGQYSETAGLHPRITSNEKFTLERVSDTEYSGIVYLDRILDEEYFDGGVCRWQFTEARVVLRASDSATDARFVPALAAQLVERQAAQVRYFWKGYYPRAKMEGFPDLGETNLDAVPQEKRAEFFSISLKASEAES